MSAVATTVLAPTKDLLRFLTCGSVDDGKSTLIGRLLFDSHNLLDDQLALLVDDSRRHGTRGAEMDYALLLDGLAAEREQGITIDVAYRFFATARRKFIVADTPGHEQYTRNMVTGASTADLAILLVDARKGLLPQTRRHSHIVALLGIREVVLAVNKMDLVDYSSAVFARIADEYREFAARIGIEHSTCIPVSAAHGDNLIEPSSQMPWYQGASLLRHLETVPIPDRASTQPMRFPVQWVNRPNADFRGYAGTLVSGQLRPGDRVRVLPSGRESVVARIVTAAGDLEQAAAGQAITLTLRDELDISRGDVIAAAAQPPMIGNQFEATLIWMNEAPLLRGRSYLMKIGCRTVQATVAPLKYRIDVNTLEHQPTDLLALNDIGVAELSLDQDIAFAPYAESRELGGFILIDRISQQTVGAGLLHFALRRSDNVHWQAIDIGKPAHARQKQQKPCVLWFTGLSGAGKSTIANLVEKQLHAIGRHTYLLDGDNVRHGLNKDLGFTEADRVENIRRVAEVAKLMVDAGLIVLTAFISPFRSERGMARALFAADEFIEVFIDTPLSTAENRDVKGLYQKARRGQLKNFTGVDSPYEAPLRPELLIDTASQSAEQSATRIVEYLRAHGRLWT
ncbi:MAG: adenylyl-sulfate kinase [Lysobacterales bacterium CG02_land_8_20_14_3_00_62_12]|nr:MAG: adenylyl-sulfate kinase [Xanthomonadales bacterium CG02_land_8_20_14_3_00_62_12]